MTRVVLPPRAGTWPATAPRQAPIEPRRRASPPPVPELALRGLAPAPAARVGSTLAVSPACDRAPVVAVVYADHVDTAAFTTWLRSDELDSPATTLFDREPPRTDAPIGRWMTIAALGILAVAAGILVALALAGP